MLAAIRRAAPLVQRPCCDAPTRGFLPSLGNLGNAGSLRRSHKWQKVVQFPLSSMYQVVADVESYALFLPWCISSRVVERAEGANGSQELETQIGVGFKRWTSQFSSTVTLTPGERVLAVSKKNEYLEELRFSWDFAAIGDTACRLDLQLGARAPLTGALFHVRLRLHVLLARRFCASQCGTRTHVGPGARQGHDRIPAGLPEAVCGARAEEILLVINTVHNRRS